MTLPEAKEAVIRAACDVAEYDWRGEDHPATGMQRLEQAVREYRKAQRTPTESHMFAIVRKADGLKLCPALDEDGTNVFLCWPTREEAERGFRCQMERYLENEVDAWHIVPLSELPSLAVGNFLRCPKCKKLSTE